MGNTTRQKLDELKDLRLKDYITEEEYAAARSNILLDAGFDIVPRTEPDTRTAYAPPQGGNREKKNGGCGCFLIVLLFAVILLGGLFAVPEDILKTLPGLDRLFGIEQVQDARRTILRFVDDLMGRPQTQEPAPLPEISADRPRTEPAVAVPDALPEAPEKERQASPDRGRPADEESSDAAETRPQTVGEVPEESAASPDSGEALPQAAVDAVSDEELPDTAMEPAKSSVWGNSVRIRSTPDRSGDDNIVGRARKGEALTILEEITNEDGEKWYRVRMDQGEREGWISARLVRPVKNDSR